MVSHREPFHSTTPGVPVEDRRNRSFHSSGSSVSMESIPAVMHLPRMGSMIIRLSAMGENRLTSYPLPKRSLTSTMRW